MKRKRLILDLDDTLGDLLTPWIAVYNNVWDDNLDTKIITDWDIAKFTKPKCGNTIYTYLKPEENRYGVVTTLWDNMLPMDDAIEIVGYLEKMVEIFVVSSISGNWDIAPYKVKWLERHFPFLDSRNFFFGTNKSLVSGDFIVDDRPLNMEEFNGRRILFNQGHNKDYPAVINGMQRVDNWKEIYEIIVREF
jgi:5'(3')-deoxyribonucleotidase